MELYKEVDLLDCPLCQGPALLEEENGRFYVTCLDCGCHTAEIEGRNADARKDAARRAASLWNWGKVISGSPGE